MPINAVALTKLIEVEISTLRDHRIVDCISKHRVEPVIAMRGWDYGSPGQEYPCWTVLDDGVGSIVYCENGFGPRCPWGLIWTSGEAGRPMSMGMDSGWFPNFLEAFFASETATALPIWQVFKIDADVGEIGDAVTGELEWDLAWKRSTELRGADPDSRYVVHQTARP